MSYYFIMRYSEYHEKCKIYAVVDKNTLEFCYLYSDLSKRNEDDIEVPKHYSHDRVTVSKDENGNIIIGQDLSKKCAFQDHLRTIRDQKLKESDWIEYAPLSEDMKNKWREYRQSLRDFINNYDYTGIWQLSFPVDPNGTGMEFIDREIDLDAMYSDEKPTASIVYN